MNEIVKSGEHDAQYEAVFGDVSKIIDAARESAVRSVNAAMTAAYWLVGHRIVEFEQSGEERAEYGAALLERLAADLTQRFGRGFSRQNIQHMRLFYLWYPPDKIRQTLSGKLRWHPQLPIRQTASGISEAASSEVGFDDLLAAFPCLGQPTCVCCRSRTNAPASSMKSKHCAADGQSDNLPVRSTLSSTSGLPSPRTRPPC